MPDVLVLCYHAVSPTWQATFSVTPDTLERQLSFLVARGWKGAGFTAAVLNPPAEKTLAVTFDDGFASVFELAAPILTGLGLPGTVFAPTSFISSQQHQLRWNGIEGWCSTPDAHELRCMSWEHLGELAEQGWEIGSHTCTHPRLTELAPSALRAELGDSLRECSERLGRPCLSVAYPYGAVDVRVAAIAQEVGYSVGARLSHSLAQSGPHLWPRVGIFHDDFDLRFQLKVSRLSRAARASRVWSRPRGPRAWRTRPAAQT
ncbi:MAG TPA: polysaccharide deacetylase family protein [Solirubrobacteraceae bacterium]|nr:polysaccharide deacetylase family protein [Solirubrobacteraceae bacterium]